MGTPLTGSAGGVSRTRDFLACCECLERPVQCTQPPATDNGELMTLVAGKRQSLLMVGDNDEVYDKKHQYYTEDNGTAFYCTRL